ncbi:Orotate phosphoribosyltransferase [Neomoorella glycerini]|uniref:Orotate phosphoribosyltransferase n=2 Tax=Neomoorella glycerini TaxID=55779 RepID=A0A6I5ZP63_9FIRM|nr:orotate phosphoribosyltransferase [Moorella glycerini]QGP91395.1 Orotate phosphoribosyltransferase [Moorella glycerini]
MLDREEIMAIFRRTGVLWEGHFVLTSGLHSGRYLQCARVQQFPEENALLCRDLAARFKDQGITAVVGPAIGAIIMSYEMARHLGARALFTERENGVMTLRRSFTLEPGERVLVVEDVITTGGSVKEVIEVVKQYNAVPVGAGVLVDRSGGRADVGVPVQSLITFDIETYKPEDCPLCRQGLPVVKPGSRQGTGK